MPIGSVKWHASVWQQLLESILKIEAGLEDHLPFSFGGGTALAVHINHRISYDIDLFYRSADVFDYYNPNKNPAVKALIAAHHGSWQFPGNYLKLELGPELGEIDILISKFMTEAPTTDWPFKHWIVKLETPAEILAKKIRYRSSQFKRRDVFDLGAIAQLLPAAANQAFAVNLDNLPRLRDRIATMQADYEANVLNDVNPTTTGQALLQDAPQRCLAAIDDFLLRGK
ncbi:nucleotidyl transferase AbiEii/AbiGii toxin family protein [Ferrovibrio sp.]|uniref:nucleotidyl transferase AbiEii/AbiGii toxin family protein n=1 Tax=Ferrovibrio sp. TaxID=1917215 RepID=UPI001B6FDCD8|nr:nucleotidyl transferase AbiEii/AbiGii toxin family protein [Ferrovibrio sp.]MBP7065362.1 nucleotidyl transferase AbiEii/AbiGii toxin family protein [Ferrovibrio sp.]